MKRPGPVVHILLCALATTACFEQDHTPLGPPDGPVFAISDAANGGRAGFYFRPPTSPATTYPGTFDPTLLPILAVRICPISVAGVCTGPDVAVFTATSSPALTLDLAGELYGAVWMMSPAGDYRARVFAGSIMLGFADIRVVTSGRDLRSVPAGWVGAVRNSAVPIRFRVETNMVGTVTVAPVNRTTAIGLDEAFTATVLDLYDNPMSGVTVDWSANPSSLATVSPASGATDAAGQHATTATGAAAGSGAIVATAGGVSGSAALRVIDANEVVGYSNVFVPRADACGRADGRICESLIGDVITDAMVEAYGVDFALTNSGGIRANLTCPIVDIPSDFCPAYTPPPFPITRGQLFTVLPFGNRAVTVNVNGAELKTMLENGVSAMPGASGRFPQVAGLCFTYDISAPASGRVTGAVRHVPGIGCTGVAIDLTAASSYSLVINDFIAAGGDGYPNFLARGTTRDLLDDLVASYISANTPITPAIQGRINCTTSGVPACPVIVP